mgnify:CR=1 FL=1
MQTVKTKIGRTIERTIVNIGISLDDNPNQNNNLDVQLYKDEMFFAKSGKLEIRSNENIELLIACTFYSYFLRLIDVAL